MMELAQESEPMKLDHLDTTILSELTINARASQVELAERVGLSSTSKATRRCWIWRALVCPPPFWSG
jgi:hypothetical protein